MRIWNKIIKVALSVFAGVAFTAVANAAVVYPALDIQQLTGDTGVVSTADGLTMGGTAITVINSDSSVLYDFADQSFLLTSNVAGTGTVIVGGFTLAASFTNFSFTDLGAGMAIFTADLIYTGGDMAGSIAGGSIAGAFQNASDVIALGSAFTANTLTAKLGEVTVVPVPAAVWLFGSGLLALMGIAKRKQTA